MLKKTIFLTITTFMAILIFFTSTAGASTSYTPESAPIVPDGDFTQMSRLVITGTTTLTFSGKNDRAEFRLPTDFYITSVGIYGEDDDSDVLLNVSRGIDDPSKVTIRPISEDPYNPGHYGGFEINVGSTSGASGDTPQIAIYFNNVYVPNGYSGSVQVKVEPAESSGSGFSAGTPVIATVASAKLVLTVDNLPSLVADKTVGPIVITENMGGAFDYLEFSLPAGFTWDSGTAYIDPGLGLVKDYDRDGDQERDYKVKVHEDKYGFSVLTLSLEGDSSDTKGTLRLTCDVILDDSLITYGDVNLSVSGEADPAPTTLKVGTYTEQNVAITVAETRQLYGGLRGQDLPDIAITENAPGTLNGDGRKIILELPSWASWDTPPQVQTEGSGEIKLVLDNGRASLGSDEERTVQFAIAQGSQYKAGKINIKSGKINIKLNDADGPILDRDLTIKVRGSANASGEVVAGKINPPVSVTSTKTTIAPGKQDQPAGDITITEPAGKRMLAKELWLDFPGGVYLKQKPVVQVTAGDAKIGTGMLDSMDGGKQRLIIPIQVSSSQASTLQISGIIYDVNADLPDGDLEVLVGGPAIYEKDPDEPYPESKKNYWALRVVNATLLSPQTTPSVPVPQKAVFVIGEKTYQANGQTFEMDVHPYIRDGRTILPLRYVGLALGIKPENIMWNDDDKTATLIGNDNSVVNVKAGEKAIYRSGVSIPTDVAAFIRDGRIMVPLRAVSQAFGAQVNWDNQTRSITITL